jgi:hypothetical protein
VCLISNSAPAQVKENDIYGSWQSKHREITSMYLDIYHFSKNNKFVFEPNAYDGLRRVLSIKEDIIFMEIP